MGKSSPTSKRSLSASISTASCSSPKEFTHAVPPQEAVLTLKDMVLNASPMHVINLINPLSGVAFARNSSYKYKVILNHTLPLLPEFPSSSTRLYFTRFGTHNLYYSHRLSSFLTYQAHEIKITSMQLTKLSPISHLVTREEFFVLETFRDDFGTTLNDSPKSELDFKPCHACQHTFLQIRQFG